MFPCPPMGVASERPCSRPYPGAAAFECSLSPVAPVSASHLRCCILSYPAAGISTLLHVLQFLCHAWAVRSTQDVSFCLPDFCDKSVVILSIILFYAVHYFSLMVFLFLILSLTSSVTIRCLDVVLTEFNPFGVLRAS